MLNVKTTLNCRGQLLDLSSPIVMGILNVTPDSFYDGGQHHSVNDGLRQAEKMLLEGAAIIDIGGMSSRPGAEVVALNEELQRTIPVIQAIIQHFPQTIISIDTVHAKVARAAIAAGASIINDISAGQFDDQMYSTVAELNVPYVLMHMQGTPKTMQMRPNYDDVIQEILDFFIREVGKLRELEVKDIILDVGYGFGKSIRHNYELLANQHLFNILDLPILTGVSRKSMIYKLLGTDAEQALNGTTALHLLALQQGAKILRVHDVKEASEVIKIYEQCASVTRA
ncbi:MAG: dihydropteroate synthase [Saprospiraceae bacterium]